MQAKLIETKNVMEEKVMQLHTDGGISDKMLLHTIGMYKDSNNNFVRVKKNAKYFTTGKPGYSYPLFKTHKLSQDEIQTIPATNIPVRIVSSISNITTSRCTAMLEALLKPVSCAAPMGQGMQMKSLTSLDDLHSTAASISQTNA